MVTPELEFYRRRPKLTIDGQNQYFRLQYSENSIVTAYCGIVGQFDIYNPQNSIFHAMLPGPGEPRTSCVRPGPA